mmetsp:Transcript_41552/g.70015  ORF Transcript_41552/g.70015 Transcript_41552/m.70015 type:complete len:202 (-) Transcript_41552:2368-2973(-)
MTADGTASPKPQKARREEGALTTDCCFYQISRTSLQNGPRSLLPHCHQQNCHGPKARSLPSPPLPCTNKRPQRLLRRTSSTQAKGLKWLLQAVSMCLGHKNCSQSLSAQIRREKQSMWITVVSQMCSLRLKPSPWKMTPQLKAAVQRMNASRQMRRSNRALETKQRVHVEMTSLMHRAKWNKTCSCRAPGRQRQKSKWNPE